MTLASVRLAHPATQRCCRTLLDWACRGP